MKTVWLLSAALVAAAIALTAGCACTASDADVAARNISKAAEQFEVQRRIVGINGITDKYLLQIEGRCSVETADSALAGVLEVTCKDERGRFRKHYLYLSDNVSFVVEQLDPISVSTNHYRVIYKPEAIVPDIDRP